MLIIKKVAASILRAGPILVVLTYLRKNVQPLPCKGLGLHVAVMFKQGPKLVLILAK